MVNLLNSRRDNLEDFTSASPDYRQLKQPSPALAERNTAAILPLARRELNPLNSDFVSFYAARVNLSEFDCEIRYTARSKRHHLAQELPLPCKKRETACIECLQRRDEFQVMCEVLALG